MSSKSLKIAVALSYAIGVMGLWLKRDNPEVFKLSWMFSVASLVVLMLFHKQYTKRFALLTLLVGLLGWLVEAVGVNTGLIFGDYIYGESLGLKLLSTPLVMAVNWIFMVYATTYAITRVKLFTNRYVASLMAAIVMVGYDFFLEPVAIRLQMWAWATVNPPIQNYIGWFLTAYLFSLLMIRPMQKAENSISNWLFACQFLFFVAMYISIVFLGF